MSVSIHLLTGLTTTIQWTQKPETDIQGFLIVYDLKREVKEVLSKSLVWVKI